MADIVIIDDDPGALAAVRAILESRGHRVRAHGDGRSALAAIADRPCDLVVTDIWMAGPDGIDILKQLRQSRPELPVVVLTGGAPDAPLAYGASLAGAFGAAAVLYKPFEKEELIAAVEESLTPPSRPEG
jgi:DNA-binding NtrC family response regulator